MMNYLDVNQKTMEKEKDIWLNIPDRAGRLEVGDFLGEFPSS